MMCVLDSGLSIGGVRIIVFVLFHKLEDALSMNDSFAINLSKCCMYFSPFFVRYRFCLKRPAAYLGKEMVSYDLRSWFVRSVRMYVCWSWQPGEVMTGLDERTHGSIRKITCVKESIAAAGSKPPWWYSMPPVSVFAAVLGQTHFRARSICAL